jgi:hypothetical protein
LSEFEEFKHRFSRETAGVESYLYNSHEYIRELGGSCFAISNYVAGFTNKQMFLEQTVQRIKQEVSPYYNTYETDMDKWFKHHNVTINITSTTLNDGNIVSADELLNGISTSVKQVVELNNTFNIGETKTVVVIFSFGYQGHVITCFCSKVSTDEYIMHIADSNDYLPQMRLMLLSEWGERVLRFNKKSYNPIVYTAYSNTVFNRSFSYDNFIDFNKDVLSSFTDKSLKVTKDIIDQLRDETWFFQNILFLNREFVESIYPRFKSNSMDITLGESLNGMLQQQNFVSFCDASAIKIEIEILKSYIPQLDESDIVISNYVAFRCDYAKTVIGFVETAFDRFQIHQQYKDIMEQQKVLLQKRSLPSALSSWDCRRDDTTCNPLIDQLLSAENLKQQREKNEEHKRRQNAHRRELLQNELLAASSLIVINLLSLKVNKLYNKKKADKTENDEDEDVDVDLDKKEDDDDDDEYGIRRGIFRQLGVMKPRRRRQIK